MWRVKTQRPAVLRSPSNRVTHGTRNRAVHRAPPSPAAARKAHAGLTPQPQAEIWLAQPRGFCAGVVRAIEAVERALALHGAPVYVYHEIVHNGHVVDSLRARGAIFVDTLDGLPAGALTVFSAHGVSAAIAAQAVRQRLQVVDGTCPLVTKVHQLAQRYAQQGHVMVVIGHAGHEEVVGTMGRVPGAHRVSTVQDVAGLPIAADAAVAYVTQTTLSLDDTREVIAALQARFSNLRGPETDGICYASQNRQASARVLAAGADLVLVVGARNSSNATRLCEVAAQQGAQAYLVQDECGVDARWLRGVQRIAVTAGASTPEQLVQRVVQRLRALGAGAVRQAPGALESVVFKPAAMLSLSPAPAPSPAMSTVRASSSSSMPAADMPPVQPSVTADEAPSLANSVRGSGLAASRRAA